MDSPEELAEMFRIYHVVENECEKFLSISAFAMKDKNFKKKSASSTLKAIENYKKLPAGLRRELEKNKTAHVSKIDKIEKMCKNVLN